MACRLDSFAYVSHPRLASSPKGRAYLWGLTAGGKQGVVKTFQILKAEVDRAMGLLGVGSIHELKRQGAKLLKQRHRSPRDYPDRAAFERGYCNGVI